VSMEAAIWELVRDARWFGGRGRDARLLGVRPLEAVGDVRSLLVDAGYADGPDETYHVPVLDSALPELVEAPDEGLKLWEALGSGSADFRLFGDLAVPTSARRFTGEQSNTNVFFDNGTLLKVLRRVEPDGDIEAELLEALRGTGAAPELHGLWKHGALGLGVLVEALVDPHDGYDLARDSAARGDSFAEHSHALGVALRTVHARLAERLGTGEADPGALASTFLARYEAAARSVAALQPHGAGIRSLFESLPAGPVMTQRVHGDCHLGQVLLSRGTWRYVDFEGEPMKSVAERRELDSPVRDVAGMLRSFDYAAQAGAADPEWLADARRSFLEGYGTDGAGGGGLVAAYELDKAIYESVYEARFRPHLIDVPLAAIEALVG
jgi:maltokinase